MMKHEAASLAAQIWGPLYLTPPLAISRLRGPRMIEDNSPPPGGTSPGGTADAENGIGDPVGASLEVP